MVGNFLRRHKTYNVLVLGSNGMLGHELYQRLLKVSRMKDTNIGVVIGIDKESIDVTQPYALKNFFDGSIHFDYCINCAAYTNTSSAENTKDGRVLDYKLNALAPKYIAQACKERKTRLIHISTDYVFSEKSADAAWSKFNSPLMLKEDSEVFPCNIYGYDKLLGELNIKEAFGKEKDRYCIMRVSWLYGMHNNKSFVHKFMANLVKSIRAGNKTVEMTSNEHSVPTSCEYVVDCILLAIDNKISGIYHAVPICKVDADHKGVSRIQFAEKILEFLKDGKYNTTPEDYIDFSQISLVGVKRDSYWPEYSVMQSSASWSIEWDKCLNQFMSKNIYTLLDWAKAQA